MSQYIVKRNLAVEVSEKEKTLWRHGMEDKFEKTIDQIRIMFEKGIIKNRLSQIKVHSFRKFATDSEINFSFPLTVIVGKNGSGKTTIMKAIKLLSGKEIPQAEFFETKIDDGGLNNAIFLIL